MITNQHTRWRMELPMEQEDAVTDWLLERGASAMYREAYPPMCFYVYFPPNINIPDMKNLSIFEGVSVIDTQTFADEDWLAKSRQGFGAFDVGRSFYVRPIWDDEPVPVGRIPVTVNPGLAFGTGGHETTRLCMTLLEYLFQEKKMLDPVLDIGAGTGILAYTAHLLGAEDVTAFDIDMDCGPAMVEFIQMNCQTARHENPFTHFVGTLEDARANRKFSLILANILLETIQCLLLQIVQRLASGGYLIVSGILAERQDEALLSLAVGGLKPMKVVMEGEWVAILAIRN